MTQSRELFFMPHPSISSKDSELIQIVDAALADAARRSGKWLVCREGCTQCCIGVFSINQLDASRLRSGLRDLEAQDPARARRVRTRAREAVARLAKDFPGDVSTGVLDQGKTAARRFANFANDEPCPVLDPGTGRFDLFKIPPLNVPRFGPPVRFQGGLGVGLTFF